MGEFKQEILKINNRVNMVVFNQGLLSQRVDVLGDKVLITAVNRRVSVLSISQEMDENTTGMLDRILILRFKSLFIREVEDRLGLKVVAHLKDYDSATEISVSVSIFERPVQEVLPDLKLPEP